MRFLLDDKKKLTKTQMEETLVTRAIELSGWEAAITVMKLVKCAPPVTGDELMAEHWPEDSVPLDPEHVFKRSKITGEYELREHDEIQEYTDHRQEMKKVEYKASFARSIRKRFPNKWNGSSQTEGDR